MTPVAQPLLPGMPPKAAASDRGCGLDLLPNLIQLCRLCHLAMPLWDLGEETRAFTWLSSVPSRGVAWQLYTDTQGWSRESRVSLPRRHNAFVALGRADGLPRSVEVG